MKTIIHHIRRQPNEIKRHMLHAFILVAAIVLILLWIYSLGTTLTSSSIQTKMNRDLEPFAALKDNMVGGYNSITEPNTNISQ